MACIDFVRVSSAGCCVKVSYFPTVVVVIFYVMSKPVLCCKLCVNGVHRDRMYITLTYLLILLVHLF